MSTNRPTATADPIPFDPERDTLYTTAEVAKMFSVGSETVRDWIKSKKMPALRLRSGQLRVTSRNLQAFASHLYGDGDAVPAEETA